MEKSVIKETKRLVRNLQRALVTVGTLKKYMLPEVQHRRDAVVMVIIMARDTLSAMIETWDTMNEFKVTQSKQCTERICYEKTQEKDGQKVSEMHLPKSNRRSS